MLNKHDCDLWTAIKEFHNPLFGLKFNLLGGSLQTLHHPSWLFWERSNFSVFCPFIFQLWTPFPVYDNFLLSALGLSQDLVIVQH